MISIKKPKEAPKILRESGKAEIETLCREYLEHKADYESGKKKFVFKKTIYGGKTVKNALIKAQNDKCFICESKISHISYGDVEHFRPKGGSRQSEDEELTSLGYYWLAYVWENLFLSCQLCNQSFKRNLFPLENPKERTASHEKDLSKEKPLFINPETDENPEDLISFRGEIPFAVDGNIRGETTIELLGINRVELNEMRLAVLKKLKTIYDLANLNPTIPESLEAMQYLEKCKSDSHDYAGAIRANVRDKFKYVID
ncbi:MAG: hypothetical protein WA584_22160 [Pyrinomonadaceae bacterium]